MRGQNTTRISDDRLCWLDGATLERIASELRRVEDISALFRSRRSRPLAPPVSAPPLTPAEQIIAGAWCEVLDVPCVGVDQNFFRLGGHSLLGTRLTSRLSTAFSIDLPLNLVFEHPTIAAMASEIERLRGFAPQSSPLERTHGESEHPLSLAQARLWFLEQLEGMPAAYNMPAAFRISGPLNPEKLEVALREIVRRHDSFRTALRADANGVSQVASPSVNFGLTIVDLHGLPGTARREEANRLAREDARRPFDLSKPPLLRATLLRMDEAEHVLLFTVHHIVFDGWSMGVLLKELSELYEAHDPGKAPAVPLQYCDFVRWERNWVSSESFPGKLEYWKNRLAGAPALLEVAADRVRPALQTFEGHKLRRDLKAGLTAELKALGHRSGTTLFMTLLAGYAALLARHSGSEDVVVGSPMANRTQQDLEGVIGFFVNTVALRVDLSGDPDVEELLHRARSSVMGAYEHQDVPFSKVVEALAPERSRSYPPLVQVEFVMLNTPTMPPPFGGLTWQPVDIDNGTARFDLTLTMEETEEGLHGVWEYNTALYDRETIEDLMERFENLLSAMARRPKPEGGKASDSLRAGTTSPASGVE